MKPGEITPKSSAFAVFSPIQRHAAITHAFLEAYERPCGCPVDPLDLREDDGLRCANCDRRYERRAP